MIMEDHSDNKQKDNLLTTIARERLFNLDSDPNGNCTVRASVLESLLHGYDGALDTITDLQKAERTAVLNERSACEKRAQSAMDSIEKMVKIATETNGHDLERKAVIEAKRKLYRAVLAAIRSGE